VCAVTGEHEQVLDVTTVGDAVRVSRCRRCHSLATDRPPLEMTDTEELIDSYVEATAGIGTIGERLYSLDPGSVRSLLDVGCGYGFGADLGRFLFGWRSVGVEPSLAGRRGAAELHLDVRAEFLTETPLADAPFDAALASEVLEHVVDPHEFLKAIRCQLRNNGVLLLTTPSAEAVHRGASEQTICEVLSVPYHHFVSSAEGLERMLRVCGFDAVDVRRIGATLVAIAATGAGPVQVPPPRAMPGEALEAYLLDRVATAPPGSALELGGMVRAVRSMAARGAFDEVERHCAHLNEAFLRRAGRPFTDPRSMADSIVAGWPPPLSLPGAAFAMGMTAMLHAAEPAIAVDWFHLAEASAFTLRQRRMLVDLDSLMVLTQSIGHSALCSAQVVGGAPTVLSTLERLVPLVDGPALAQWRCRVFVEAVCAGHYDDGELLLPGAAVAAHATAASADDEQRSRGLDALLTWGILRLVRGEPKEALQLFTSCADACATAGASDHDRQMFANANRHIVIATDAMGPNETVAVHRQRPDRSDVRATIETYWCDASGVFVQGWLVATGYQWDQIGVKIGNTLRWAAPGSRRDVSAVIPGAVNEWVGFTQYLVTRPESSIQIIGRADDGAEVVAEVGAPTHALPVTAKVAPPQQPLRMIDEAPPGPILVIGARAAEGAPRIDEELRTSSGREVVSLDIHPGLGVDVVGDVHDLGSIFAPASFAATVSSMVFEHLSVPWLAAAQCAQVTMPGGRAVHIAPFLWPGHAQPNDFWRFSPGALEILFGPATGYQVIASGAEWPAVVVPHPSWRDDFLTMPTLSTMASSWVVSRRLAGPHPGVQWQYDAATGTESASRYPVGGLAPRRAL